MTLEEEIKVRRCARWHQKKAGELEDTVRNLDKLGSMWTLGARRKIMEKEAENHRRWSHVLFMVSGG